MLVRNHKNMTRKSVHFRCHIRQNLLKSVLIKSYPKMTTIARLLQSSRFLLAYLRAYQLPAPEEPRSFYQTMVGFARRSIRIIVDELLRRHVSMIESNEVVIAAQVIPQAGPSSARSLRNVEQFRERFEEVFHTYNTTATVVPNIVNPQTTHEDIIAGISEHIFGIQQILGRIVRQFPNNPPTIAVAFRAAIQPFIADNANLLLSDSDSTGQEVDHNQVQEWLGGHQLPHQEHVPEVSNGSNQFPSDDSE